MGGVQPDVHARTSRMCRAYTRRAAALCFAWHKPPGRESQEATSARLRGVRLRRGSAEGRAARSRRVRVLWCMWSHTFVLARGE